MAVTETAAPAATGVLAPRGYAAGVAAADIRGDGDTARLDIAVLRSDPPAAAAGVFTRNLVKAAPVVISQLTLRRGTPVGAIVVNAGNANACTGPRGLRDALRMCAAAAGACALEPSEVLVCSTGVIGRPLPIDRVLAGIRAAAPLRSTGGDDVARAIMTTDTRPKTAVARFSHAEHEYSVGGIAKGSGMLHPDMATLLAFLTTDCAVVRTDLQPLLQRGVDATLNCISVDGDTSTNDSVVLLANGAAGGPTLQAGDGGLAALEDAVLGVLTSLTEQIVADAEGATRWFRVSVAGAEDPVQARVAARTVAQSPLVKAAVHGADPNWGRIVAALGRSGAAMVLDRTSIAIGGVTVFTGGVPADVDLTAVRDALTRPHLDIDIDLGCGTAAGRAWGCDLSADYVRINAEYTT